MENIPRPILGKEIYKTRKEIISIYETMHEDSPCYAIVHKSTQHTELVDYQPELIEKIINKMEENGALSVRPDSNVFRFSTYKTGAGGSLRPFVYAHYKGVPLENVNSYSLHLVDKSLKKYNILDLRSENIYDAGGYRPEKKNNCVTLWTDENHPERKCLEIKVFNKQGVSTNVCRYSDTLHKILTHSHYGSLSRVKDNRIHFTVSSDGGKSTLLSKFIKLYFKYIGRYGNSPTAADDFMKDFPHYKELHKGVEAAHIIPTVSICDDDNLIFMDGNTNKKMLDFLNCFVGQYGAFATKTAKDEIILEITAFGQSLYYVCRTAEQYLDLQRVMLGKAEFTKNTQNVFYYDGVPVSVNTPAQEYRARKKDAEPPEYVRMYWAWCDHKEALLTHYNERPQDFRPWNILEDRPQLGEFMSFLGGFAPTANSPLLVTVERVTNGR